MPVFAQTLQGDVEYNEQNARAEAFSNIDTRFSPDMIASNLIDPNHDENINALLSGNTQMKDRVLCFFSSGIYGVRYNDDPYRAYYYTKAGNLDYVDKKNRLQYPQNVTTYDISGNLIGSALYVSKYEQYIFDNNKKLTKHWIRNNGYDKNGNLISTRVYVE